MAKNLNCYPLIENPDGYTTAERSLLNTKDIKVIAEQIETIGDVIQPENVQFADGSLVSTQATRAEDVISEEDKRLQQDIDSKVSNTEFNESQNAQNVIINSKANQTDLDALANVVDTKANQSDLDSLQSQVSGLSDQVDINTGDINALETRMDTNEAKDSQQDIRLGLIEDELQAVGFDYSAMTDTGLVGTTTTIITPTIVRDFQTGLATNAINGVSQLTTTINTKGVVKFGYELSAEQGTGQLVDFTIELYNLTTGLVVDSSTHTMDFAGTINFETIGQSLIGSFEAGNQIQIRVRTDVGNVNITKSKGIFEINSTAGGLDITYDYNVVSTSTVGGANTLEDINQLNVYRKANEAAIEQLQNNPSASTSGQVEDTFSTEPTAGINPWRTDINANTTKLAEIYNQLVED